MSVNIYDKTEDKLISIAGDTVYADSPIGSIIPFGGSEQACPAGWLICNGNSLSKNDYFDLWKVIGYRFGGSDSTFNLPDLRETIPVGVGTRGSGVTDHDIYTVGQFKDDQLQNHAHYGTWARREGAYFEEVGSGYEMQDNPSVSHEGVMGARTGTTTHGKQLGVNYIIKAKQAAIPADFMNAVDEAVEAAAVDAVENGNMKAVTSNAVYDALNASIIDLTADETVMTYEDYTVETLGAHMYQVGGLCWVHIDMRTTYTGEVALDTDGHKDFWSNKFSIPDFDDVSGWTAIPCFGYISNSHRTFEITLNNFGATGEQKAISFRIRYSEDEPISTGDVFNLRCICCFAKA